MSDARAIRLLRAAAELERLEVLLEHAGLSDVAAAFAARCIEHIRDALEVELVSEGLSLQVAA